MKIPQIIEDHKQLFGTYSAMALSNIRNILDHIATLGSIENNFNPDSDSYWDHPTVAVIKPNGQNHDSAKEAFVMEKLYRYFPFLPIIAEEKRKNDAVWAKKQYDWASKNRDFKRQQEMLERQKRSLTVTAECVYYVLKMVFNVLKAYRDHCAHYMINDPNFLDDSVFLKQNEQPLSKILNAYFTVALRDSAKKYSYSTQSLGFIQDFRYKAEGRKKVIDTSFFLSIVSNDANNPKIHHISGVGMAMLICMFLEKKYVNVFLQKLPIYSSYKKQSEEACIIRNTFGIHTAKLPKDRIVPEKTDFSIALDMLNELKRCPKELFATLSYPDQNAFRIVSSDMNDVLQVRHTDRFAQLSLGYIDFRNLFKDIRFQVNMGKMRYLKTADKHCIDGVSRVRVLERKINAFGRIHEVEKKEGMKDLKLPTFIGKLRSVILSM